MPADPRDIHDLGQEEFLEEVHSFEFWFQAVEGYLSGTTWGHRPDTPAAVLSDAARDRLVTVLCNYTVGETAALEGASSLIAIAPSRRANPSVLEFRRRLLGLVAAKDWDAAVFAQNVLLECLEFAVFHDHAREADPVTAEILRLVIKDERRHVGFGENELGRRLAADPALRTRLARLRTELDALVLDALSDTARLIGLDRTGPERIGRAYVEAVERLGLLR